MSWILLTIALTSGMALGFFYFGGLWLTIRKVTKQGYPPLLVLISFLIRMALVMGVFYVLLTQHWAYMITALASFLIIRQHLLAKWGTPERALSN
ncbi:ATP synthase subunit I [Fodinibius sediminis]|nr:ATP synthase subunit I [Fodinibius sediminis]